MKPHCSKLVKIRKNICKGFSDTQMEYLNFRAKNSIFHWKKSTRAIEIINWQFQSCLRKKKVLKNFSLSVIEFSERWELTHLATKLISEPRFPNEDFEGEKSWKKKIFHFGKCRSSAPPDLKGIIKTPRNSLENWNHQNGHIIFQNFVIRPENCPTFGKTNIYVDFSLAVGAFREFDRKPLGYYHFFPCPCCIFYFIRVTGQHT